MAIQSFAVNESRETSDLAFIIEFLFIEHFKKIHGSSPTLAELKQHLVFTGIDKLVDYVCKENSDIANLYSKSELIYTTQLYIRHLH